MTNEDFASMACVLECAVGTCDVGGATPDEISWRTSVDLWRDLAAANGNSIQELNPWCFLTLGMIVLALALAAHLQSLTFLTLGVILLSHMRWRARIADGGSTRSSCSGTCGASHLR